MQEIETAKKSAGKKAAELIENGMKVGLGTGSTAQWFIESLIERHRQGLKVQVVASSQKSQEEAKRGGLPLIDIRFLSSLDITVDGADEIDPEKRMIKGGGGALLREKIIASMSKELVIIVDETKLSSQLGKKKLPIEIIPFGYRATLSHLHHLGFSGKLRFSSQETPYITDNGNYLYDLHLNSSQLQLPQDHERILSVPGVVETGFFLNLAGRVIIGFLDGTVRVT